MEKAKESKVIQFEGKGSSKADLKKNVTRGEFIEVLQQITENINQMTQYQMDDMNTMYAKHLFPNEIKMSVLESLIIEKLGITSQELTERYNKLVSDMQKQAKELKEKQEGAK